jgi:FAS-associated factor 2
LAFQQTLALDQERERLRQEEARRKREEEEAREREQQMLLHRMKEKEKRKEALHLLLPAEPPVDDKQATKIMIRLPDGSRLQRRFRSEDQIQVHSSQLHYDIFSLNNNSLSRIFIIT